MEEWKEYKLGDVCSRLSSGKNISASKISDSDVYPVFGGNGLRGYTDNSNFTGECAIIGRQGSFCGNVRFFSGEAYMTEHAVVVCGNEKANTRYLSYLLSTMNLGRLSGQSAQPGLAVGTLAKQLIKLPPLPTQQKIAAILSSLDDKIELNNKINTNLERQVGALFKNWFVDFEPFGGKMPEGWKVGKLSEYCNFQEGYVNPAQTHNEYFNGDVKWLRAVDINESFILNTSRTLTKCGFESAGKSSFLFKPGSIAISKSGTVGRLGIISDFMCGNRAVIGIELKDQQNLSYIHQYLKSRQTEFPDMAVGSVQKNLYVSILENLDIIIPSKEVLEKYAKICMPFYDQIKTNCVENNNLSSIRDTLLPKLMNGEIEV